MNSLKIIISFLFFALVSLAGPKLQTPAVALASLTDPAKLSTLKGERAANPRLFKIVYWLETAKDQGQDLKKVLAEAAKLNGTSGTPYADFIEWGLIENLRIAENYGVLDLAGMEEVRRGKAPTITKGAFIGQEAAADHVIPRAVCPELQNQVFNLELLAASENRAKSDKIGQRQVTFAKELYDAKLLSEEGWKAVERNFKPSP
jgi:hypothetical protein